jgi:hypothetical protein
VRRRSHINHHPNRCAPSVPHQPPHQPLCAVGPTSVPPGSPLGALDRRHPWGSFIPATIQATASQHCTTLLCCQHCHGSLTRGFIFMYLSRRGRSRR